MDEKEVDEKNPQLSTRVRTIQSYTKKKYDTDIGPLTKEETKNGIEWDTKEQKTQRDFLWALGPQTTHQATRSKNPAEPDKIVIDKLTKLYNRYYLPKRKKYTSRGGYYGRNKQTRKNWETTGRPPGEVDRTGN